MKDFKDVILTEKYDFIRSIGTVCIVGAGLSGVSAAALAKKLGKKIKVTDADKDLSEERLKTLRATGAQLQIGSHTRQFLEGSDLIILSPGVDTEYFLERYTSGLDIPCVGEIEFSYWFCKSKDLIAVTGTNGKTTTAYLLGEILKKHLKRGVHVLGNIGSPFSSRVLDIKEDDVAVLETSSFQLERVFAFNPHIACLLNFSEDHLDRYPDVASYFQAKKNIFTNQDSLNYALFPRTLQDKIGKLKAQKIAVADGDSASFIKEVLNLYGLQKDLVDDYMKNFKGLAHRLETVATKRQVTFINDSKATNVSATAHALGRMKHPVILIAGGKDKGLDYSLIRPYLGRVRKIILIGEAKERIIKDLQGCVGSEECDCIEEAVSSAFKQAESGDTVLLSPMCSSFDMFKDYKERGNAFKEAVNKLPLK